MTNLELAWISLASKLLSEPGDAYISIRKFFLGKVWKLSGDQWDGVKYTTPDLGYRGNSTKKNQLRRNYLNEPLIIEANQALLSRVGKKPQTSVSFPLQNIKKNHPSTMGFCMQNAVITHLNVGDNPGIFIDIFYRVTELFQKFPADLLFLSQDVIPLALEGVDVPIKGVSFHFSNIYLSAMFFPLLFKFEDPLKLLLLAGEDPRYYRVLATATRKVLQETHNYTYQTRVKLHTDFHTRIKPSIPKSRMRMLRKHLEKTL